MDQITTQVVSILFILLTLVVIALLSRRRRRAFTLRPLPAYEAMPVFVGRAIEADRPVHISLGSAGIGGESTILAIASAELAYQVAYRAAIGDSPPILTLSESSTLPLGQDTLRRAYQNRALARVAPYASTRWYPSGSRSLAFAAAVTALLGDDDISSSVMAGSYGPELALIMDASTRRNLPIIAVSDQLEGQAVAYALSDAPLIGEEVFAAGAYLGRNPGQVAETAAIDVLRWVVILAILGGLIVTIVNQGG